MKLVSRIFWIAVIVLVAIIVIMWPWFDDVFAKPKTPEYDDFPVLVDWQTDPVRGIEFIWFSAPYSVACDPTSHILIEVERWEAGKKIQEFLEYADWESCWLMERNIFRARWQAPFWPWTDPAYEPAGEYRIYDADHIDWETGDWTYVYIPWPLIHNYYHVDMPLLGKNGSYPIGMAYPAPLQEM